jgi:hypothetical protein
MPNIHKGIYWKDKKWVSKRKQNFLQKPKQRHSNSTILSQWYHHIQSNLCIPMALIQMAISRTFQKETFLYMAECILPLDSPYDPICSSVVLFNDARSLIGI